MYDRAARWLWFGRRRFGLGSSHCASGKIASYYLDGKQVTLDATGARLVGEGLLDLLGAKPAQGRWWDVDRG